ncbi:MAG TPA: hypothetical protein VJT49_10510 [Amycolatopsis sp.]|uniref:hypothetical protein n=1 Tax=Amycolatopsis sp. TaxID=37632 RepID=UPI002B492B6E|nr:hypothetical protein [Amycolatopsis sp.]HKS45526.1 hypothetical protein [Amycolatopsis sp.]
MAAKRITPAPVVAEVRQWTGTNFTKIGEFTEPPIADNGDGTLTVYPNTSGATTIPNRAWIPVTVATIRREFIPDEEMHSYQEVTADGPYNYSIGGA